ncbi:MAG: hypothetical protein INR73_03330 [Williamsia sp.]|nr:hypothetical protein [Williamsia sp.]
MWFHGDRDSVTNLSKLFDRTREPKTKDEIAWEEALQKNTTWAYIGFMRDFSFSKFSKQAQQKINELVEEDEWNNALAIDNPASYSNYLGKYPQGRYVGDAHAKLDELKARADAQAESRLWVALVQRHEPEGYREYLRKYPDGRYAQEARNAISLAEQEKEREKQWALQQEAQQKREQAAEEKRLKDQAIAEQNRAALQARQEQERAEKEQHELEKQRLQQQRAQEEETKKKAIEARKKQEEEEQARQERDLQLKQQQEEQRKLQRKKQGQMILEETTIGQDPSISTMNKIVIAGVIVVFVALIIFLKINKVI